MKGGTFLSLVSVENKKVFKRISTLVVVIIIIIVSAAIPCGAKISMEISKNSYNNNLSGSEKAKTDLVDLSKGDSWRKQVEQSIKNDEEFLANDDANETFAMQSQYERIYYQIAVNKYYLSSNINPYKETDEFYTGADNIWRHLSDGSYWNFVALFTIICCSYLIAGEFAERTMKTMIVRPYTRFQILSAKLITTLLFALSLTVICYIVEFLCYLLCFGGNTLSSDLLLYFGGKIIPFNGFLGSLSVFLLGFLSAVVYIIFAFFLNVLTRSRAFAVGISIFLIFGTAITSYFASTYRFGKWIYFCDTDFTHFPLEGSPVHGLTLPFALIYSFAWTAVLLLVSYVVFKKRDVN